ncbi:MAG: hypothetical protein ABSB65_17240 [Candidatus Acidiferrales bacterium]|jgi:hypothetical protein
MKMFPVAALFLFVPLQGCGDQRVSDLDQRVKALEQSVKQLQMAQSKITEEETKRHTQLQVCIFEANSKFQGSLEKNGAKRGDGATTGDIEKQKRDAIEQCKAQYAN